MANTTNLNLGKLSGSEKLKTFPTMQAGNMDAIDSAFGSGFGVGNASDVNSELNSLGDGLAIIANGDTHAAITSGQYVYVRKHGTLSDGLYTANSNISANGTLSSSNLTANSNGGLNVVYSALNSDLNPIKERTGLAIISSSTPAQFNIGASYGIVVLMGLFQGIGAKIFIFVVSNGTVTIKDFLAGTDYTGTGITASYSNNILSISQSFTSSSKVTFIQSRHYNG